MRKAVPTSVQADSAFQIFIETFADAFGIENPSKLDAQKREILPESVQIDAVVTFPENFDFTTLQERIFPFFRKENIVEYKGENDALSPMRLYQYIFTEMGIITTYLLSKKRKDRAERQPLSQRLAKKKWVDLKGQGAVHSCCTIILSTNDPVGLRKTVGFNAVDSYPHLQGALYCLPMPENEIVGSIATYIVVLNELPLHPKNAPLLLLSTGKKQSAFCQWLIEEHEGIAIQEKERYLFYLLEYNLIQDQEVMHKMLRKAKQPLKTDDMVVDFYSEQPEEERIKFVQKVLRANTPLEMAQKAFQVDTPLEAMQKMLETDSPAEAVLKLVQSDEEIDKLLELIQQRKQKKADK